MELRLKIEKKKIETILEKQESHEFPEFMKEIRKATGLSRRQVAEDLGVEPYTILTLESGSFRTFPDPKQFSCLAGYFGVSPKLLKAKAEKYVFDHRLPVKNHLRRIMA